MKHNQKWLYEKNDVSEYVCCPVNKQTEEFGFFNYIKVAKPCKSSIKICRVFLWRGRKARSQPIKTYQTVES